MIQKPKIFKFKKTTNTKSWTVIDDAVMGGKSSGSLSINKEGHGVFKGTVSLKNNGGFSLLKYVFDTINTTPYSKIIFRIKGDGKRYQFRIKAKSANEYSYISYFDSPRDWETVSITLSDMAPFYRGRKVNIPNYSDVHLEEIAFLIGNKKEETFQLEIDYISLE